MPDPQSQDGVLPRARALAIVLEAVPGPTPGVRVPLAAALGRHLYEDLYAPGPWPTTDRSAMDGFAVVAGDDGIAAGTRLDVIGRSLAGHPFAGGVHAGQAVAIMTGGVVPAGGDAVVAVEDTSGFGQPSVTVHARVRAGQNVRPKGSEVVAGQRLIARGTRLRAAEIGVLAVLGRGTVEVFAAPAVAILATGDEVVDIDAEPAPHQVRNSNAHALAAQVRECGGEPIDLGIARDDAADLRARLQRGLAAARVLLTIGGVSKGTHDLVHGALRDLGVEERLHGIALKPGKPTFFGVARGGAGPCVVFGLPGNPASCFTVFDLLVRPLLRACVGAVEHAYATQPGGAPAKRNAREQAIPARLATSGDGRAVAVLDAVRPSGDPFGLLRGDGHAMVPAGADPAALAQVEFVPYAAGIAR